MILWIAAMRNVGGDKRFVEVFAGTHAHALVVKERASALFSVEELIGNRIIGDGGDDFPFALQGYGDGEVRKGTHEIEGAVDRIHDEAVFDIDTLALAAFLAEEAIAGAGLFQFLAQDLLAFLVCSGHIVAGTFQRNLQIGDFAIVSLHAAGGFADGGDHDGHDRCWHSLVPYCSFGGTTRKALARDWASSCWPGVSFLKASSSSTSARPPDLARIFHLAASTGSAGKPRPVA